MLVAGLALLICGCCCLVQGALAAYMASSSTLTIVCHLSDTARLTTHHKVSIGAAMDLRVIRMLPARVRFLRAQLHKVRSIGTFFRGNWSLIVLHQLLGGNHCNGVCRGTRCVLGCRLLSSSLLLMFDLLASILTIEKELLQVAACQLGSVDSRRPSSLIAGRCTCVLALLGRHLLLLLRLVNCL